MNNDLISRSKLKEAIKDSGYSHYFEIFDIIDNAPTVEPNEMSKNLIDKVNVNVGLAQPIKDERPKGEWICDDKYLDCRCSICNSYALERGDYPELSPYCPQCGAKMEVKTNETNDQ